MNEKYESMNDLKYFYKVRRKSYLLEVVGIWDCFLCCRMIGLGP